MARCQFNDLLAPGVEEWIGFDPDGGNTLLDERGEGGLEFSFAAGFGDVQLVPERARGSLNLFHLRIGGRKARVKQATDRASLWDQLPQQFYPLRHHFHDEKHHARHIAAGAIEAGHEALVDRVRSNHEDDRDRRRRRLCRPCRLRTAGSRDHGDRPARELGRQRRQSISSALGPAVIDADIAMLDIASLAQAAPERRDEVRELAGRFQAEKPDHRHRRLLRMRRDRPRDCRAAEQCDELAAFPLTEMHPILTGWEHIAEYRKRDPRARGEPLGSPRRGRRGCGLVLCSGRQPRPCRARCSLRRVWHPFLRSPRRARSAAGGFAYRSPVSSSQLTEARDRVRSFGGYNTSSKSVLTAKQVKVIHIETKQRYSVGVTANAQSSRRRGA